MKYRDMLIAKFGVKEKTVASKAKTLGQMFVESLTVQIDISEGKEVLGNTNNPRKSWRDKNGNVSCKIGVLPLFVDDQGNSVTFSGVSEADYKQFLKELKSDYEKDKLKEEIESLEKRKKAADKRAADSRARAKENRSDLE